METLSSDRGNASAQVGVSLKKTLLSTLKQLLEATRYAQELGCEAWEFAVDAAGLLTAGLTENDLRWLVKKGYVAQAIETSPPEGEERTFRNVVGFTRVPG